MGRVVHRTPRVEDHREARDANEQRNEPSLAGKAAVALALFTVARVVVGRVLYALHPPVLLVLDPGTRRVAHGQIA